MSESALPLRVVEAVALEPAAFVRRDRHQYQFSCSVTKDTHTPSRFQGPLSIFGVEIFNRHKYFTNRLNFTW